MLLAHFSMGRLRLREVNVLNVSQPLELKESRCQFQKGPSFLISLPLLLGRDGPWGWEGWPFRRSSEKQGGSGTGAPPEFSKVAGRPSFVSSDL